MRHGKLSLVLLAFLLPGASSARADDAVSAVTADPAAVTLNGPKAVYSLLIHGKTADGRLIDLTHAAHYRSLDAKVAAVSDGGVIRGVADGSTTVEVEAAAKKVSVAVTVKGAGAARRFNFENDVIPLFGRFGRNSSACHGKAEGQNGFKLSVFGFDPPADYAALVKEGRGRRVFPAAPEASLLLAKVSGRVPHGGGVRIPRNSPEYETLRDWVAAGVPLGSPDDPKVTAVRVEPSERQLAMRGSQQLRVIARYSDGREADVTAHARFQSNNDGLASVSASGLVSAGEVPGEAAVMAGYMNAVDVFRAVVPRAERVEKWPDLPENNFIDGLVYNCTLRDFLQHEIAVFRGISRVGGFLGGFAEPPKRAIIARTPHFLGGFRRSSVRKSRKVQFIRSCASSTSCRRRCATTPTTCGACIST